jgi:hypothetical protein
VHAEAGERSAVLKTKGWCLTEVGSDLQRWTSSERELQDVGGRVFRYDGSTESRIAPSDESSRVGLVLGPGERASHSLGLMMWGRIDRVQSQMETSSSQPLGSLLSFSILSNLKVGRRRSPGEHYCTSCCPKPLYLSRSHVVICSMQSLDLDAETPSSMY